MTETLEEILAEFERIKVIKIDSKGNIHVTKFGQQVYDHMIKKGLLRKK